MQVNGGFFFSTAKDRLWTAVTHLYVGVGKKSNWHSSTSADLGRNGVMENYLEVDSKQ